VVLSSLAGANPPIPFIPEVEIHQAMCGADLSDLEDEEAEERGEEIPKKSARKEDRARRGPGAWKAVMPPRRLQVAPCSRLLSFLFNFPAWPSSQHRWLILVIIP